MKKIMCALLCAAFMMTFTACSQNNGSSSSGKSTTDSAGNMTVDTENVKEGSYDLSFTKRDSDSSYDESGAVTIKMEDSKATASDSSVSVDGTKLYSNVVVSTPALKTGETYKIICGGTVSGTDDHGFASKGSVSGGTTVKEIKLDTENYSNGGNTMGGGRMGGGNMGDGDRMGGPMGGNGSMGGGPMDRGSANNNFSAN